MLRNYRLAPTRSTLVFFGLVGGVALLALWYFFRPERAFIDVSVNEPPPAASATVLLSGQFHPEAHEGRGVAEVLALPDGRHVVRFSAFETLNGPDVRVYLLRAPTARNDDELAAAGFLDLGPLKGNVGDQNYLIPTGSPLSAYRAVSVWCRRFGVNFTTAVLTRHGGAGDGATPPRGTSRT